MSFEYCNGSLWCEPIAEQVGTPAYVYSADAIPSRFRQYDAVFADLDQYSGHEAVFDDQTIIAIRIQKE